MASAVARARHERRRIASIGYGGAVAPPVAVGGAALLAGEADGFATDFTYATDASRVAVKTAGATVSSGLSFFTQSGTSSKWVYDVAGVLVNVAAASLAIDYDPVTHVCKGLLCEPQATNGQTRSSDFTTSWTTNDCTVSANIVTAPNGLSEADALIPLTGARRPFVTWTSTTTAATVTTYSLFAKNGTLGTNWIEVQIGGAPTVTAWFNLATGVKGTATGSPISYTMTAVGNGWYRLAVTFTAGAGSATTYLCADDADGSTSGTTTGDGVKPAFYLWGTQMEAGTVATSPIPTVGATVTRAADNIRATAASIGYSATAGSWWAEVYILSRDQDDNIVGSNLGGRPIFYNSGAYEMFEGALLYVLAGSVYNSVQRVISAFTSGSRAITAKGLTPSTDAGTTTTLLAPTDVYFGSGNGSNMHGYIRKVRYLPRRPTNAELVTMTT
jgi:hypothetical protein